MGLDNGIVLRIDDNRWQEVFHKFDLRDDFYGDSRLIEDAIKRGRLEIELCYWRKCWGIRNEIINAISTAPYDGDCYHFDITLDNINEVISILEFFCNKDNWENHANSIWDYNEIREEIELRHIKNMEELIKAMEYMNENNVKYTAYFYDSY